MHRVACAGFPVPVSRYFGLLDAVEIVETELGLVSDGTVRRWKREAPPGAAFSLLAPRRIGDGGFAAFREQRDLLDGIAEIARRLDAVAVVFCAPDGVRCGRELYAAAGALSRALPRGFPVAVFDVPGADVEALAAAVDPKRATVAYDPFETPSAAIGGPLRYVRCPGPAGRRSRYDEAAIARLAEHVAALPEAFVVFRNQDMLVNARALRTALEEAARRAEPRPHVSAERVGTRADRVTGRARTTQARRSATGSSRSR
ncbi:MAG: DUF72 domain-containing protein [Myxococcota bacterium]|nr:DUF72 domain-containing protein [Myxococcota bacterium]MDW8363470.1 DUF72 domain-containing protein [Myxococcales bacterium]